MVKMNSSIAEDIKKLRDKANNLSVLYVEDDDLLREKTFSLFKKIFLNVDIARDGIEGLDKYKRKKYDLVITDILMPNMDGFTLIKNILQENNNQEIIISSASEQQFIDKAAELGIRNYIHKPIRLNELLDVLNVSIDKLN